MSKFNSSIRDVFYYVRGKKDVWIRKDYLSWKMKGKPAEHVFRVISIIAMNNWYVEKKVFI